MEVQQNLEGQVRTRWLSSNPFYQKSEIDIGRQVTFSWTVKYVDNLVVLECLIYNE